jgi:hypothetical protein
MDAVVGPMKAFLKAEAFRVIAALTMLASSALVIEAGQRWR